MSVNEKALQWLGDVTPATYAIAEEIVQHLDSLGHELPAYGPPYNGPVMHGYANGAEHGTGRALDVMVMAPGAIGEAVVAFAWANRKRYDLTHIIWKQRIKSTVVSPGVWRKMDDRGSATNNHMDHPHLFFGTNATVKGSVKRPRRKAEQYYQPVGVDMNVIQIQKAAGATADGFYGPSTKAAVRDLQEDLGVTVDGYWGPDTEAEYKRTLKRAGGAQSVVVPKREGKKAPSFPLPAGWYFGPKKGPRSSVSGYYGHRNDLRRWQKRMAARGWTIKADGRYGPKTAKVVRQFQKEKGLGVDGLIGARTWAAAWTEDVTP